MTLLALSLSARSIDVVVFSNPAGVWHGSVKALSSPLFSHLLLPLAFFTNVHELRRDCDDGDGYISFLLLCQLGGCKLCTNRTSIWVRILSRLTSASVLVALPNSAWKQASTELCRDGWDWVCEELLLVSDGFVGGELELVVCSVLRG